MYPQGRKIRDLRTDCYEKKWESGRKDKKNVTQKGNVTLYSVLKTTTRCKRKNTEPSARFMAKNKYRYSDFSLSCNLRCITYFFFKNLNLQ